MLALTLLSSPRAASRWTTRAMAGASGTSQSAVSRIWRGFGLQPPPDPSCPRREEAPILERFEALSRLYLDQAPGSRIRVHRAGDGGALRNRLRSLACQVSNGSRVDLVLCGCGPAQEREWGNSADWADRAAGHPGLRLHLAPPGPLWFDLLTRWFPPGDRSGPAVGVPGLMEQLRAVTRARVGFGDGPEPFTWTPLGREFIERGARRIR